MRDTEIVIHGFFERLQLVGRQIEPAVFARLLFNVAIQQHRGWLTLPPDRTVAMTSGVHESVYLNPSEVATAIIGLGWQDNLDVALSGNTVKVSSPFIDTRYEIHAAGLRDFYITVEIDDRNRWRGRLGDFHRWANGKRPPLLKVVE